MLSKFLIVLTLIFTFSLGYSGIIAAGTGHESDQLGELLSRIDEIRHKNKVAAVGLVIARNGQIEWKGSLGISDKSSKLSADENTFYRVGSITKAFTGLALLKLQEQGQLKLTDKISEHISAENYQNEWSEQSPITIEQLLEHTAGLTDMGTAEYGHEDINGISLSEGLAFNGEHHKIQWQPGLHSSYSNLGAGFAGAVIEKVTGQSYDDYLSEHILKPLEMSNSTTLLSSHVKENLATGYNSSGDEEVKYWHVLLRPFGALNSSPKEMANFLIMLINRGQLNSREFLRESSIKRMEGPQTTLAAKAGLTYGYGLGNYQTEHHGFLFHGHGGTASGFLARMDYTLANKSGYVVMINSNKNSALSDINEAIQEYLVGDLNPVDRTTDTELDEDISDYLGFYQPVTSRMRVARFLTHLISIRILVRQDQHLLLTSMFNSPVELVHQGNNLYRIENYSFADTALIKTDDGEIYLQNDSNYRRISSFSFYMQMLLLAITLLLTIYSILYYLMVLLKQLYLRRLPNQIQRQRLLRVTPFLLFAGMFVLLIFFSTGKGTIAALLFNVFGLSILMISLLTLVLALIRKNRLIPRLRHLSIAVISSFLGLYLYLWDLISQPIWS